MLGVGRGGRSTSARSPPIRYVCERIERPAAARSFLRRSHWPKSFGVRPDSTAGCSAWSQAPAAHYLLLLQLQIHLAHQWAPLLLLGADEVSGLRRSQNTLKRAEIVQ